MERGSTAKKIIPGLFLLYLLVQCMATSLPAQINPFSFQQVEHITTQQGLANNNVYSILQDKKGFLWFLTFKGLQRYDGYDFKTWCYNPQHTDYILPGWYNNMIQDNSGVIWIADGNAGLWSFNPEKEIFSHYVHEPANKNSLSDDQTNEILIDKRGNIWIANYKGLDEFDPHSGNFKHYNHIKNDSSSISNNYVMGISLDEKENLWITTASPGVDCFSIHTGKVIRHFNFGSSQFLTSDANAGTYGVFSGRNGNIWIGSRGNGLFCYNTSTKSVRHYLHDEKNLFSISQNSISKIFEDSSGNLWLVCDQPGFDFFENARGRFFHINKMAEIGNSGIIVCPFLEDRSHNIWIAATNGIFQMGNFSKPFHSYSHDEINIHSLSDNSVCAFFRDKAGQLFVGSNGVDIMNDSTKKFNHFSISEKGKNIFEKNQIWQIYQDSKNILWFCTVKGLVEYNPATKEHHWYTFDSRDSTTVSAQSVTNIIEDRKGRYWVSTFGGGLNAFDPVRRKFRAFNENNSNIGTNALGGLFEDKQGILYIGSLNGGLIAFNPGNETFKVYRHDDKNLSSISSNITTDFVQTANGIIWISTNGGGICALNPQTEKFKTFSKQDDLCSDAVITLVEDDNKNLWIGTLDGISCFTPPADPFDTKSKFHFRNYSISDGLPMQQTNHFASYKDIDGSIYFGTESAGFYCFKPDELKDNTFIPPVFITSFELFNKPVTANDTTRLVTQPVENIQEIKLGYKQNFLSFSFAALNYFHPEKNQYAYRLKDFDKDWIYTDATKRFANYTNLDPGEYTFEVKGSNNDGIWNELPATIHLIIAPPFWQTWWFKILILLAIATIIYGIYRYRLQQVISLQNIRNKIAGDLHDDIGSTLNSISVYSEVLRNKYKEDIPELKLIGESARKVIDAMSDIVWTINPGNDSFEKIIFRMRSLTHSLMKAKKIEYTFKADENLNELKLTMMTRRNFYLIFKESLNNLVKYSFASRVSVSLVSSGHEIELLVRDNGIGFDPDNAPRGNGLFNMTSRAKEMKANLRIESKQGAGTTIKLLFTKKIKA